jgi:hypothetical protein
MLTASPCLEIRKILRYPLASVHSVVTCESVPPNCHGVAVTAVSVGY